MSDPFDYGAAAELAVDMDLLDRAGFQAVVNAEARHPVDRRRVVEELLVRIKRSAGAVANSFERQAREFGTYSGKVRARYSPWLDETTLPGNGWVRLIDASLDRLRSELGEMPDLRVAFDVSQPGLRAQANAEAIMRSAAWKQFAFALHDRSLGTCEACGEDGTGRSDGTIRCALHAEPRASNRIRSGEVARLLRRLTLTGVFDVAPVSHELLDLDGEGWSVRLQVRHEYPIGVLSARGPNGRTGVVERWLCLDGFPPLALMSPSEIYDLRRLVHQARKDRK